MPQYLLRHHENNTCISKSKENSDLFRTIKATNFLQNFGEFLCSNLTTFMHIRHSVQFSNYISPILKVLLRSLHKFIQGKAAPEQVKRTADGKVKFSAGCLFQLSHIVQ